SMCRRRGAIVASVPLSGIRIVQGDDVLKLYQFNTHTAKHFFCSECGIYTHHQRRSDPSEYGYNVGCLEGLNPYELG
ncbi:GFA family protein, partial [Escherichia coli]|nr:GFA family protein [Escherichia coli]